MKKLLPLAVAAGIAVFSSLSAQAASGVTVGIGSSTHSNPVVRLGLESDWSARWFESSVGHLTGYWDLGYTYWDGGDHNNGHTLSFSPVFRYEFGNGSVVPYVEAGIGVSVFSRTEVDDQDLGGAFNFEDRIGAGVRFAGNQEVGVRAFHYSNAGISEPNDGIEAYMVHYRYSF